MEDHGRQQEADALGAAVHCSGQAARLTGQMEAQVELQQVLIDAAGDFADRLLGDARKDGVAQLLEEGRADAGHTVYALWSHSVSPGACREAYRLQS